MGIRTWMIRKWINKQITGIGTVSELTINGKQKKIHLQIELEGEPLPVTLEISRYLLEEKNGIFFFTVQELHISKVWMQKVLTTYLLNKQIVVPPQLASVIPLLGL